MITTLVIYVNKSYQQINKQIIDNKFCYLWKKLRLITYGNQISHKINKYLEIHYNNFGYL